METKELTPKQECFCNEYLIDLCATKACVRAGFSERNAHKIGPELMKKPHVAARIKELMDKRAKKTGVTQERIINELKKIAFSNLKDVARWNASGVDFVDSDNLTKKKTAFISEISQVMNEHGGSLKIKKHDKVKALELLGKHVGMFNKLELTGKDGGPIKGELKVIIEDTTE